MAYRLLYNWVKLRHLYHSNALKSNKKPQTLAHIYLWWKLLSYRQLPKTPKCTSMAQYHFLGTSDFKCYLSFKHSYLLRTFGLATAEVKDRIRITNEWQRLCWLFSEKGLCICQQNGKTNASTEQFTLAKNQFFPPFLSNWMGM